MEAAALDRICRDVYRKFPEMNGIKPRLQANETGGQVLMFATRVQTGDGRSMKRLVRVSVSPEGRVLKMSTSKG